MIIHWRRDRLPTPVFLGFPCGSAGKESACSAGDLGLIPGWLGRPPEKGKGYPLQNSGLENSMDCVSPWGCKELDRTEQLLLSVVRYYVLYLVLYTIWAYFCIWCGGVFWFHWFLCNCPAFPVALLEETFSIMCSCLLYCRLIGCRCVALFLGCLFCSVDISFCGNSMPFDYCSFVVLSEVWEAYASNFVLFFTITLAVLVLLWFHINFRIISSSIVNMDILKEFALNI